MSLLLRVLGVSIYGLASAAWLRVATARTSAGLQRILLSSPLLLANLCVPFIFNQEEICSRTIAALVFVWLASFKIVGLGLDRGPLREKMSFAQFAILFLYGFTPLHFVKRGADPAAASSAAASIDVQQVFVQCLAKLASFIAITWLIVMCDRQSLTADLLYVLALYCWVGAMGEGPAALFSKQLGVPLAPFFDEPYRSSSLSDFWGRRWNISAANSLRFLIYEPITDGSLLRQQESKKPSRLRQTAAVHATFIGSGIMHELCLWYVSGQVTGHWMLFFSLQGPLLVVEGISKRVMRWYSLSVPRWLSILLTLGLLLVLGHYLFIPPAFITGIAPQYSASIAQLFHGLVPDYMAGAPKK